MALTIKQLNDDASILLNFEPIIPYPGQEPFRILLDPWITETSHKSPSRTSSPSHPRHTCISSLQDLPEPDLVIISQDKPDHCNEATLKQLARTNTKTVILAEPSAAKAIRTWKYFGKGKVVALERWEDPRLAGRETASRIVVPPHRLGGDPGEVTVAFIPQKRDPKGSHAAIGITYRPPPSRSLPFHRPVLTPPTSPKPPLSDFAPRLPSPPLLMSSTLGFKTPTSSLIPARPAPPPTPPDSPIPRPLRSVRSTASLSPHARDRTVSVIFSPHGISYRSLESYATAHLVVEAALPLTALLHCFDTVSHPWWLGGSISSGMPVGQEIATTLGAQVWVSTHDGEKSTRGLAGKILRKRKYRREDVKRGLGQAGKPCVHGKLKKGFRGTEILVLDAGEEIALTSEGIWEPELEARPSSSSRFF